MGKGKKGKGDLLRRSTFVLVLVAAAAFGWSGRAAEPASETVHVAKTYNNAPFDYQMRLIRERPQFRVYRLTYPSPVTSPVPQNNTIPADYYVPRSAEIKSRPAVAPPGASGATTGRGFVSDTTGRGVTSDATRPKRPAVICLHILDGNEPLTDLMCSVLAERGVAAIAFKLPYYGPRGLPKGPVAMADDPKRFVGAIDQAGEDVRRTIDLLASRPEVNPEQIGIAGISLGGLIAASAAGAEPRLHRAGLILAGGDLPAIIHHARETRQLAEMLQKLPAGDRIEVESRIEGADPLRFAPGLRQRALAGRVLMINAAEDEVIPRACTEKLAAALGISNRVVWFPGLGHYTAIAELPRALRMTADFFAQDLPAEARHAAPVAAEPTGVRRVAALVQQAVAMLAAEPEAGRCHLVDLAVTVPRPDGSPVECSVRLVRGANQRFSLRARVPQLGEIALGHGRYPWMLGGGKTLVVGTRNPAPEMNALTAVEPRHLMKLRMAAGIAGSVALAPEMVEKWVSVKEGTTATAARTVEIGAKDARHMPGSVRIDFRDDGRTPAGARVAVGGIAVDVEVRAWQANAVAADALFEPPEGYARVEAEQGDVCRVFSALLNFAAEQLEDGRMFGDDRTAGISIVARDSAGHGLLCRTQGKTILMVSGTPAEMGAAHGTLLRPAVQRTAERVVYLVGGGDTMHSGDWFVDRMVEVERRTGPHIPPRFLEECDALANAAGVSRRDGRWANLFPERFHCSGVALRGKATAGGRVLHARVLDYMTQIGLQDVALVTVFAPEKRSAWISLGYAGFIGTVTAMNERGLAVGEMGGRGEGQWDGVPMSLLLRDVMERAATVEEALAILRAAPRTCEYYYVLSDRAGTIRGVECTPEKMVVIEPGQSHPRLPPVPEDVVLLSGEDRAKVLADRIRANYGRIDVPRLAEIIKRPVAMQSNLHDAIFSPETLEMWFADAGRFTPACDEPYARVNLAELLRFFREQAKSDSRRP